MTERRCTICQETGCRRNTCTRPPKKRECIRCGAVMERPKGNHCYKCDGLLRYKYKPRDTHYRCSLCGRHGHNRARCPYRSKEAILQAVKNTTMTLEDANSILDKRDKEQASMGVEASA